MTHRTSPSAPASTLPHDATSALTQEQLSHLLQQVAPRQLDATARAIREPEIILVAPLPLTADVGAVFDAAA